MRVAFFSAVVALTPFIIYLYQRYFGILPTAEQWYSQGNNHGPWRYSAAGFSLIYPLLTAFAVSVYEVVRKSNTGKSLKSVGATMLLVALQIAALCGQLYFLWWTID